MTQERPTGPAHEPHRDRTGTGPRAAPEQAHGPDRDTLSPRQAARIAVVGKSTIMRAIDGLDLPARRDNRNQWRIQRADLNRWMADREQSRGTGPRTGPGQDRGPEGDTPVHLEITGMRAMLARLEEERAAEIARLEAELTEARATLAAQAEATAADRQRIIELETRIAAQDKAAALQSDLVSAERERAAAAERDRDRWHDHATNPPRRRWWPWRA